MKHGRHFAGPDVARFCAVDLKTVHAWAKKGSLPHERSPGGQLRFRRTDLVAFFRAHGFPFPKLFAREKPRVLAVGALADGRYKNLRLDAQLRTESVDMARGVAVGTDVLEALSVGTRDQLATLIRVTIADQLKAAIVLDDHLVHTDPKRLEWFREVLTKTALNTQVIVFTCRPEDYLLRSEIPDGVATRDLAGGSVRVIDMMRVVQRWEGVASTPPAVGRTEAQT